MSAQRRTTPEPVFFADAASFRAWLARHAATAPELWVGFMKRHTGEPSITWPEAVDEALCVGWIDGIRKRIDADRYQIRFTPRRAGSNWSAVNVRRMKVLLAEGRVQPAGMAAFSARQAEKTGIYSYEQRHKAKFDRVASDRLRSDVAAWTYFQKQPPGYRQLMTYWVMNAVKPETRERRLSRLIEACANGRRLLA